MDNFDKIFAVLFIGILFILGLPIILLSSGYMFYEDVTYIGYVEDITFSGGGLHRPDMVNFYFSDGRIVQARGYRDFYLRTNCTIKLTIRQSLVLYDRIVDVEYLEGDIDG